MATNPALREQARALRQQGFSIEQIAARVGVQSRSTVTRWVADLPTPAWTARPRAKDELRARARVMRAEGATYTEIIAALGVAKSSVSLWVRDVPPPPDLVARVQHARHMNLARWSIEVMASREADRRGIKESARQRVAGMAGRDLMIAGAVLYWAEGSKDKPYRRREEVKLINSDADVIRLFLRWLDLMGAPEADRRYRLSIHESADLDAAHRWWSRELGVALDRFDKPTLKRHRPTTVRKNIGDNYHGCLVISVVKSRVLYQQIEGLWRGVLDGVCQTRKRT
jgi:transposase